LKHHYRWQLGRFKRRTETRYSAYQQAMVGAIFSSEGPQQSVKYPSVYSTSGQPIAYPETCNDDTYPQQLFASGWALKSWDEFPCNYDPTPQRQAE
jgi:hypothetical protein